MSERLNAHWGATEEGVGAAPKMGHMGLTVSDIDRSARFYERLGFHRLADVPLQLDSPWVGDLLGSRGAAVRVLMMQLGDGVLELVQYDRPDGGQRTPLSTWDVGAAHVAVQVADVKAVYDELAADGVEFNHTPITIPDGVLAGGVCLYGRDPDGNMFELMSVPSSKEASNDR